jgi:fucose 4-O-acetylase-like acetyltransferase
MRLHSFDYFRGIAIIIIVSLHSLRPWTIDTFTEDVLHQLLAAGSVLFVFISGFFFHHVFYKDFHYKTFLIKKSKYILIPYLFLSTLGIIYYTISSDSFPYLQKFSLHDTSSWDYYPRLIAIYLLTGRITTAYWFIPYIYITFILSPVFIRYIKLTSKTRIIIFLALLLVAIFIHRPAYNISPLHSILYFTPAYLLGINCSINRDQVLSYLQGKTIILGITVIALAIIQVSFNNFMDVSNKAEKFSYLNLDLIIIQKIFMCFFILSILHNYETRSIPVIYKSPLISSIEFLPGMIIWAILVPTVLLISLFIAYSIKLLLKEKSRYLIGW